MEIVVPITKYGRYMRTPLSADDRLSNQNPYFDPKGLLNYSQLHVDNRALEQI